MRIRDESEAREAIAAALEDYTGRRGDYWQAGARTYWGQGDRQAAIDTIEEIAGQIAEWMIPEDEQESWARMLAAIIGALRA